MNSNITQVVLCEKSQCDIKKPLNRGNVLLIESSLQLRVQLLALMPDNIGSLANITHLIASRAIRT